MILYTSMPQELIFQPEESAFARQKFLSFEGIPVLAEAVGDMPQEYTVIRVMSTDPNHFLDDRCMPGSKITIV